METMIETIQGRMSVDEALEELEYTEDLEQRTFAMTEKSKLKFTESNDQIRLHIGSDDYRMHPEAVIQALKIIGLTESYAEKTPHELVIPHLNYWFSNKKSEQKALIQNGAIVSFCRPGTEVYSSTQILKEALGTHFGSAVSVVNFSHDIYETHFTLLDHTRAVEVFPGDPFIPGVKVQTSLIGLKPTQLSFYVQRELENAGSISCLVNPYHWDRKNDKARLQAPPDVQATFETVYTFTNMASEALFGTFEAEVRRIKALKAHTLDEHVDKYLADILKKYSVPPRLSTPIIEKYTEKDDRNALDLWTAFGEVGFTDEELDPRLRTLMFKVAGEIARHPKMCGECHRSQV